MKAFLVTETRVIAAPAQDLFDIVADPAMHPRIDGSGTVRAARGGNPERLGPGSKFAMDMKIAAPYKIENTVIEFEEGHRIAWRHFNGHVWSYTFDPVDAKRTTVTEQWDARPARNRLLLVLTGFSRRARKGMRATLGRLDSLATATPKA